MTYAIWTITLLVGIALAMQDSPVNYIGWVVIVAGALIGYRVGRERDRRKDAEAVARELRDQ